MRVGCRADIAGRIAHVAFRSLLREVSAAPKPGLVDRDGTGSHGDMDFMTFADSAIALEPTFFACASLGLERGADNPDWVRATPSKASDEDFLAELRKIGVAGEARMFEATGGVNTHKGALFLLGLLVAAVGALVGAGIEPLSDRSRAFAARLARGLSDRELPKSDTHGARVFRAYGSRGVRGEAESGFASLDSGALSVLRASFGKGTLDDAACIDALLLLMATVDDTTVLHRGGPAALAMVRRSAIVALGLGGSRTESGRAEVARISDCFVSCGISPGGSADLLSAGIFLVESERFYAKREEAWQHPKTGKMLMSRKKLSATHEKRKSCAVCSTIQKSLETPVYIGL